MPALTATEAPIGSQPSQTDVTVHGEVAVQETGTLQRHRHNVQPAETVELDINDLFQRAFDPPLGRSSATTVPSQSYRGSSAVKATPKPRTGKITVGPMFTDPRTKESLAAQQKARNKRVARSPVALQDNFPSPAGHFTASRVGTSEIYLCRMVRPAHVWVLQQHA